MKTMEKIKVCPVCGFIGYIELAAEVVRCKDCYNAEDDITHMYCTYFGHKVYGDDYCSNAVKRREDGDLK